MAAASTEDQQQWIQCLCQAVAEGMGVSTDQPPAGPFAFLGRMWRSLDDLMESCTCGGDVLQDPLPLWARPLPPGWDPPPHSGPDPPMTL